MPISSQYQNIEPFINPDAGSTINSNQSVAPLQVPVKPLENSKAQQEISGSTFTLNNTSYSGADIKLVVHIYDQEKVLNALEKINGGEQTQEEVNNITREIAELEKKQEGYKQGTQEKERNKDVLNKLTRRKQDLSNFLDSQLNEARDTKVLTSTKTLANVQTLSLSIFRDKKTVRSFGSVAPRGIARASRELSGTIIFTVFDEDVLYEFLNTNKNDFDASSGVGAVLLDQLPPVDITISFANEYGQVSRMGIFGVEFVDEGQVMSIEDIITENTVTFVARDFDPMRSVYERKLDEHGRLMNEFLGTRASSLIMQEDYKKIKGSLDPFAAYRQRRSPWL